MKRITLFTLLLISTVTLKAQSITLDQCLEAIRSNYPLLQQRDVQSEMGESLSRALWNAYIPQLSLDGRVTYQSDVTNLDLNIPEIIPGLSPIKLDIPEIPKLQYNAYLQATQLLWDGGRVKAGSQQIKAQTTSQIAQIEANQRQVEEGVIELYFSLLMLDAQRDLQQTMLEELQRQYDRVNNALQSGVATQNDLDAIRVEQIRAEQSMSQIRLSREAIIGSLAILTGMDISNDTEAITPEVPASTIIVENQRIAPNRAEHRALDAQTALAEASWNSFVAEGMPTLALFARGGYGRPGLNMLNPDPSTYFMYGATLSWNFGRLYDYTAQQKKLKGSQQLIELQRAALEREIQSKRHQYTAEARQYQDLIEKDREIVDLQQNISDRSELQHTQGTLSTTDYLQHLTQLNAAKQTKEVHQIQYLRSLYRTKSVMGELSN